MVEQKQQIDQLKRTNQSMPDLRSPEPEYILVDGIDKVKQLDAE